MKISFGPIRVKKQNFTSSVEVKLFIKKTNIFLLNSKHFFLPLNKLTFS